MMVSHETALDMLARLIASATGVSIIRMQSAQRGKTVGEARKLLAELAYDCGYTKSEIGRYLNKDHTTIGYYLRGHA